MIKSTDPDFSVSQNSKASLHKYVKLNDFKKTSKTTLYR